MRLSKGSRSLGELMRRYGFQDKSGCVNHRDAAAHFERATPLPSHKLKVPSHLLSDGAAVLPDVGQLLVTAFCWTSFPIRASPSF